MRREITITVLLIMVVVALILGMKFASGSFEGSDARKFVLEDLKTKFPGADKVEIVGFEPKTNTGGQGYYAIKASVSDGLRTACPARTNYYYNYPAQNFVAAPPEPVVTSCKVCETKPCMIAFEEEAIIASHTLAGTEAVHTYVTVYPGVSPEVTRTAAGWDVIWSSSANYNYEVVVGDDGSIRSVQKI